MGKTKASSATMVSKVVTPVVRAARATAAQTKNVCRAMMGQAAARAVMQTAMSHAIPMGSHQFAVRAQMIRSNVVLVAEMMTALS